MQLGPQFVGGGNDSNLTAILPRCNNSTTYVVNLSLSLFLSLLSVLTAIFQVNLD